MTLRGKKVPDSLVLKCNLIVVFYTHFNKAFVQLKHWTVV